MNFKSAYLKLTIFYVAVVMLISISFSLVISNISKNEFNMGLKRQGMILRSTGEFRGFPDFERFRAERAEELNQNLTNKLILFNILIFVSSSLGSYFLAKKTLRPIEEMLDLQNRFTADASHELRTPLTAMKTQIEVGLRDKNLSQKEEREILESSLEEIAKLESLSKSLLELSNYQNYNAPLISLSINEVLKGAEKIVAPLAKNKNIEIKNNINDHAVLGDRRSLLNLFVIILDNAIKYSPRKRSIEISSLITGHFVVVKIKDYGVGIKATEIPYIFNRFYRADVSRSKEVHGYGLGLSIAKKIVENHKGKIEVESIPKEGTIFSVKIPLEKK